MMLYLSGHSKPDVVYAVNCAVHYIFCPRHSHEVELRRIGRYLKATNWRGLVLDPLSNMMIDCYPDADFSCMYRHKKINDPAFVKSRTGYIITVTDCPILWQSKLQSKTTTLSHSHREL